MKFYLLFVPFPGRPERIIKGMAGADPEGYQAMLACLREQAQVAEAVGFEGCCFTEQYLNVEGITEITNSPIMLEMYVAACTSRLKIGQLGNVVVGANPLKLAQDLATLDHMLHGRTFVGLARGNSPRAVDIFAQHLQVGHATSDKSERDKRNREVFEESVRLIKTAWTEETFSFQGKYWKIPPEGVEWHYPTTARLAPGTVENGILRKVGLAPRPYQKPHPPIYAPFAFSMTTARYWARETGTVVTFVSKDEFIKITIDVYNQEREQAGLPPRLGVAAGAHLCIGDTSEAAQSVLDEYNWLFKEAYTVEPYNVPLGRTFFGTPDQVRAQVERLHEDLGIEEFFLWHNTNFFGRERERRMVELFGEQVIAKVNG